MNEFSRIPPRSIGEAAEDARAAYNKKAKRKIKRVPMMHQAIDVLYRIGPCSRMRLLRVMTQHWLAKMPPVMREQRHMKFSRISARRKAVRSISGLPWHPDVKINHVAHHRHAVYSVAP